jgi:hypothetical protein
MCGKKIPVHFDAVCCGAGVAIFFPSPSPRAVREFVLFHKKAARGEPFRMNGAVLCVWFSYRRIAENPGFSSTNEMARDVAHAEDERGVLIIIIAGQQLHQDWD